MSLEGRVLAGRYQLRRHLADGSMGSIWVAHDVISDVQVAVKLMNITTDRAANCARFEQEAKALALLESPHVIRIVDHGTDGATPFMVMELLEGADLLTVMDASAAWPHGEVAALILQVATGLHAAQEAGLIHRDVKPRNIFLSKSGAGVIAKLLDFGIVKWMEGETHLTGTDVVLGSPLYMSPEQIRAQHLDARVDVWALAVVAFRLLAGEPPFIGNSGPEIASRILAGTRRRIVPPAPKALELERFFDRAFAADIHARFGTAMDLAKHLILIAGAPAALRTAERALSRSTGVGPTRPRWEEDDSVTNIRGAALPGETTDPDATTDEIEDTQSTNE